MKVTVWYRKNLKMTPPKLAAQVAHAVARIDLPEPPSKIIVLMASDAKFRQAQERFPGYTHRDLGLTEVDAGTETVHAYEEADDA